jgi:hypothetical protein
MLNGEFTFDSARWIAVGWAAVCSGIYVGWWTLFERWLEPWLRRRLGMVIGAPVIWVPAGGMLRIWGLREVSRLETDAAVGFLGSVLVLSAGLLPAIALGFTSRCVADPYLAPASYLISAPLVAVFVIRILLGKQDGVAADEPSGSR